MSDNPPPRPIVVPLAIGLLILSGAINLVGSAALIADGVGPAWVVGLIVGLGLALLILRALYRGRNWARILLTALAAIGTVLLALGPALDTFGYTWLDLIGQTVVLAAIVLLWLPGSRRYFAAATRARAPVDNIRT